MKRLAVLLTLVILASNLSLAQQTSRGQKPSPQRIPSDMRSASRAPRVSSSTTSAPAARGIVPGSSPRVISSGMARGSVSAPVTVQTYNPRSTFSSSGWYHCNQFVYRLLSRYQSLPGQLYLWRYAQGDSPLTRESVEMALSKSVKASEALSIASRDLLGLIADYQAGQLANASFEELVKAKTQEIRKHSKNIRKDHLLQYLDNRQDRKLGVAEKAQSVEGLRSLTGELRGLVDQIERDLSSYYAEDKTRVVQIDDLQRPSFDSLTKGIDRLAKTISKSASRL